MNESSKQFAEACKILEDLAAHHEDYNKLNLNFPDWAKSIDKNLLANFLLQMQPLRQLFTSVEDFVKNQIDNKLK